MGYTRAITVCLLVCAAALAVCDGAFMAKAKEATPKVPYQRAFVSWKAGKETLIVESILNAPAGEYAWVVPLPAVPEKVEACSPGTLETVSRLTKPYVKQPRMDVLGGGAAVWLIVLIAGLAAAFRKSEGRSKTTVFLQVFGLLALGLVVAFIFRPVYAGSEPSAKARDTVVVHQSGQAGAFAYDVVGSKSAVDLKAWLTKNGYALPEKAGPAVDRYVQQGWCFAAMKLKHEAGPIAPNPVRFVFPAKLPIYPMALTGTTTDRLLLDLFVAVEGLAEVKGLEPRRAMETFKEATSLNGERAQTAWNTIAHPDIADCLWPHATITYLRGDLTAKDLQGDFQIDIADPNPRGEFSVVPYVNDAALYEAAGYGLLGSAFLLIVLVFWATRKEFGFGSFVKVFLISVLLPAAGAGAWFATLTKVEAVPVPHRSALRSATIAAQKALAAPGNRGPSPNKMIQALKATSIEEGDVPYGYTVKTEAKGGWTVTLYGPKAEPYEYRFDKKGNPVKEERVAPKPPTDKKPTTQPGSGRLPGSQM